MRRRTLTILAGLLAAATIAVFLPSLALASHVGCGDVITEDTTLDSDVIGCSEKGIIIGADNVTLDLDGHIIERGFGPSLTASIGVDNSAGHDNVTIEDGKVRSFRVGVELGANERQARHNVVRQLNLPSGDEGVRVVGSQNRVERSSGSGIGPVILVAGDANTIEGNDLASSHTCLSYSGEDNLVKGNTMDCDGGIEGFGSRNRVTRNSLTEINVQFGILITGGSGTVIDRNRVASGGHLTGGIVVSDSRQTRIAANVLFEMVSLGISVSDSEESRIEGNVVLDAGKSGIQVSDSDRSLVRSNRVLNTGNDGIALLGSDDVRIEDNTLRRNWGHFRNREANGLFVSESSSRTLVAHNTASDNRDDGIDVASPSTTLTANTASMNGDLGIEGVPGVIDGGGNKASDNGNPLQCLHVVCKGRPVCLPDATPPSFTQLAVGQLDGTPSDLAVDDFDGDPPQDVAVAIFRGVFERGGIQLVLNRDQGFEFGPFVPGGIASYTIDAGDVDGDGDVDVAVPNTASDDVSVFTSDGFGAFQASQLPAPYLPRGIAVADYDGDGREDVATTSAEGPGGGHPAALRIFYRSADNSGFDPAVAVPSGSQADRFYPMEALAAADLNADGHIDIVGADDAGLFVGYRKADNSGFAPVTAISRIEGGLQDVATGDFNGDGLTDLATASILGGYPPVAVVLRRPDNSGFMPAQYFDVVPREYEERTTGAARVTIADIDGDGRNDVAVSLLNLDRVAVMLRCENNRGFEPARLFDAGSVPLALGAADMDSDGDTDLIVGNRDSQEIRLLVNQSQAPE